MSIRVFLIGAGGTGKSTLADAMSDKLGYPVMPSLTDYVKSGFGGEIGVVNLGLRDRFQEELFTANLRVIKERILKKDPFICDRSLDCLAYTSREASNAWMLVRRPEFTELMELHRDHALDVHGRALVFFVRPSDEILKATRASDGGRRVKYLTDSYVYRLDGAMEWLLESNEIPYISIETPSMRDRLATVLRVCDLAKG